MNITRTSKSYISTQVGNLNIEMQHLIAHFDSLAYIPPATVPSSPDVSAPAVEPPQAPVSAYLSSSVPHLYRPNMFSNDTAFQVQRELL